MVYHSPWSMLEEVEANARGRLTQVLNPVQGDIQVLHDAADQLLNILDREKYPERVVIAAGALKRVLDELRSVWLLLSAGYTAGAAAAAADLWEHAMLAACASQDDEIAKAFVSDEPGGARSISPKNLALRIGELFYRKDDPNEETAELVEFMQLSHYVCYRWLCQIKHPTFRAIRHTSSSNVGEDGVLVLAAGSDSRESDDIVKFGILAAVARVLSHTLMHFSVGLEADAEVPEVLGWWERVDEARRRIETFAAGDGIRLPFSISDFPDGKRYGELLEKYVGAVR